MADRNLRIRMLLEAGDKATKPMRDIAAGSSRLSQSLRVTRDRLKDIERAQADVAGFRQLKTGLRSTEHELGLAQTRVGQLAREMQQAGTPTKKLAADFAKAKREAAQLTTQHAEESAELQRLRDRMRAAGMAAGGLVQHERDLRTAAARTTDEIEQQSRRLVAMTERQKRLARGRESFGKVQGMATGLAAGGASGIATAIAVGAPIAASARGAMDLEEGMAGVAKVTNLAGAQLKILQTGIVDLSTRIPMTAVELANIAAAAGAAGVGMDKFGKPLRTQREDLLAFTDAAARMGIAFDMSADDAGSTMAKWRQAFGITQPEVEALGDRVNALTNKFGGRAPAVSGIITRIGPLGKVAGVAAPQIAALASSLNSIGIEEEIAATGIKNTMLALTKGDAATKSQIKAFDALGLSASKVAKDMQTDGSGTIVDVLTRLSKQRPDKQASMLDNLFGSESIAAIAPLLTNLDGLKQRLGLVGDQSKYAGSMTAEFRSRINTTKGATDLALNGFQAVNLALGQALLPTIKQGALRFSAMALRVRAFAVRHPEAAKNVMLLAGAMAIIFGILGIGGIAIAAIMGPIAILNAGLVAMGVAGGVASVGLLPIIGTVAAIVLGLAALAMVAYAIYSNWGGITSWFAGIWGGIKAIVSGTLQWLGALPSRFAEFGRNMIMGLINGVTGMLGNLKATIVGAASAAATWFKQKLGIHSPSRVFAGFGGYMMAGLHNGIADGEDAPVRRLDTLSKRMAAAIAVGAAAPAFASGAMGAGAGAGTPSSTSPTVGSGSITIQIYQQPGQDAQALAEAVRKAIAREREADGAARRSSYADRDEF